MIAMDNKKSEIEKSLKSLFMLSFFSKLLDLKISLNSSEPVILFPIIFSLFLTVTLFLKFSKSNEK